MTKWYGKIGFADTAETSPGVWSEGIVKRPYYGDVLNNTRRLSSSDKINDDVIISNRISIVADPYSLESIYKMRFATFMGSKWKITDVEVEYPRIILTLGSEYNDGEDDNEGE